MPRLPAIVEREQLPENKRESYDYLVKTRGKISAGYATLLHSPEFAVRVAHLGTFLRFESSLPEKIRELAIFATAAEFGDVNEQASHARAATKLGVSPTLIEAVNSKSGLAGASGGDALPILCARELAREHRLSDATFEAVHRLLGNQGTVELIGTIGYYAMLACVHNAMQDA